jgi:hypothetical protein
MSNYTKVTNFAAKDSLPSGNANKVVRGSEIDTEFNNIATAVATKTDNASAAITGGTITGITDLAIADGGTGASTANAALNNLLPSQTSNSGKYLKTDGTNSSWDALDISTADITGTLPIANGGTGATTASGARTALGLAIGTDVQAYDAQLADVAGLTPTDNGVIIGNGTNFVVESGATLKTSLGLTIGTDVQAYDAQLADIAGLTPTDDNFIVGNGTNFVTESGATARTSLGLGSIATQDASNVTITGGSITGITDLAVADGGTGASTAANARVNLLPSYTGNGSKVLTLNSGATDVEWTTPATGTGDVVGPASATDNAFARFDTTTGKLIQNSSATLDDSGAPTFVGSVAVSGTSASGADIKLYEDTDNGTNYVGLKAPVSIASDVTWTLPSTDGTNGQALVTNGSGTLSWTTAGGSVTISNDTSTSTNLYPTFVSSTSGTATTLNTGNAKLLYKPSTGELQSTALVATNGIMLNANTIAENYTIASTNNGLSAGPVTVNSGITVTVSSGSVWTVV